MLDDRGQAKFIARSSFATARLIHADSMQTARSSVTWCTHCLQRNAFFARNLWWAVGDSNSRPA